MPTKVEEARVRLMLPMDGCDCGQDADDPVLCGDCQDVRATNFESAIREEERAQALLDVRKDFMVVMEERVRRTKVRVLEELGQRFYRGGYKWAIYDEMLKEARAEGASEPLRLDPPPRYDEVYEEAMKVMQEPEPGGGRRSHEQAHPYKTHETFGPQGQCPHGMYDGCLMCESYGKERGEMRLTEEEVKRLVSVENECSSKGVRQVESAVLRKVAEWLVRPDRQVIYTGLAKDLRQAAEEER